MAKTLAQLRTDARELFGQTDANKSNVSDARLNTFANDGLLKAQLKLGRGGAPVVTTNYTTDSTALITLNSGTVFVRAARIKHATTGKYHSLEHRSFEWLRDNYPDFENDTSGIPRYIIQDTGFNDVRLYPTPNSDYQGTDLVRVDSLEGPTVLSADGDTPDLPDAAHPSISNYMAYRAHLFLGNDDSATQQLILFRSQLKSVQAITAKLSPRRRRWTFGSRVEGY